MENLKIKNNLAFFPELEHLGVKNFFTFNNETWGNMRLGQKTLPHKKYIKAMEEFGINSEYFIYLAAHNNDNIQHITSDNLIIYKNNYSKELTSENLKTIVIETDGIITKEEIPLAITPADCAVICMSAIDKKDGKRFVIYLHSGFIGTLLKIYNKALKHAHLYYSFENSDLNVFIFPMISGKYYKKSRENLFHHALKEKEWKGFLNENKDHEIEINFNEKIIKDLKTLGIKNILNSNLDTFEENIKENLYSYTYQKNNSTKSNNRFGVFVSL